VCATKKGAKNLSNATIEKVAGDGQTTQTLKGQICKFISTLERDGIKENSARTYLYYLQNIIDNGADLLDPESVKTAIAQKVTWSDKSKAIAVTAYSKYLQVVGGTWKPPKYKPQRKVPYIPKTEELDCLITAARKKLATYLMVLKSTGMRSGEAWLLKWRDIDFSRNTVTLNETLKHGTPRMFKVDQRLIAMINTLPKTSNIHVFGTQATGPNGLVNFAKAFRSFRVRTAFKMQNPDLNRISFHSFRHWFATMEYHKTKNILHVQERLGHKNITTTEIYTHLVSFDCDAYHSAAAKNDAEAHKLIETGFEYVCTSQEGTMLFRKLK
jgi:integrase